MNEDDDGPRYRFAVTVDPESDEVRVRTSVSGVDADQDELNERVHEAADSIIGAVQDIFGDDGEQSDFRVDDTLY